MTKAMNLLHVLLVIGALCLSEVVRAQQVVPPADVRPPSDAEIEACRSKSPALLKDLLDAGETLTDIAHAMADVSGTPPEESVRVVFSAVPQAEHCLLVAGRAKLSGVTVPPELSSLLELARAYARLFQAYSSELPEHLGKDMPACKELVESRNLKLLESFVLTLDPKTRNLKVLLPEDVSPFYKVTFSRVLLDCSNEAEEKGWMGVASYLRFIDDMINRAMLVAVLNNEEQLLNVSSSGRPVNIQIQALPPSDRPQLQVSQPEGSSQSCTGTVIGEGDVKIIDWHCH